MQPRIMYIESKAEGLTGPARIGLVAFSRSGRTLSYRGMRFRRLKGGSGKANHVEISSGDEYWISGPRRDGADRLYGEAVPVEVDADVRAEYWTDIRRQPHRRDDAIANR